MYISASNILLTEYLTECVIVSHVMFQFKGRGVKDREKKRERERGEGSEE